MPVTVIVLFDEFIAIIPVVPFSAIDNFFCTDVAIGGLSMRKILLNYNIMLNFRLENLYHKNLLLHLHHNESNSYQHQPITTTSGETALPDATDYVLIHLLYRELQNTEAAREPGRLFWYKLVKHIKNN